MHKGDVVLVRASTGEPGVRRIWDPRPDQPYVCHEEYWARWERHKIEPICWPVPRDKVFRFDAALVEELAAAFETAKGQPEAAPRLHELWKQATPY